MSSASSPPVASLPAPTHPAAGNHHPSHAPAAAPAPTQRPIGLAVRKRSGQLVPASFDEISARLVETAEGLDRRFLDPLEIAQKVIQGLYPGITTEEIDKLSAQYMADRISLHPDYGVWAVRLLVSNLHKTTPSLFSEAMEVLYQANVMDTRFITFVRAHREQLDAMVVHERDLGFDFFGLQTLYRSYMMTITAPDDSSHAKAQAKTQAKTTRRRTVERPQYMWLRVATAIHMDGDDAPDADADDKADKTDKAATEALQRIRETYDIMSTKGFTHATPTLFNAGTRHPQYASCFLMGTQDSIKGLYETVADCAMVSKWSGGLGLHVSNVRARGSLIKSTHGTSDGIIPYARVLQSTVKHCNQSGKRNGSMALYLEPHHPDVMDFLELKLPAGAEDMRTRDLFLALWVSDVFMERVRDNKTWSLFCPSQAPGLDEAYGDAYRDLYEQYEREGRYMRQVQARDVWQKILVSQIETGTPYMCYKDHVNRKSNHSNVGTVRSSNLCVAGDTPILTRQGWRPIRDLVHQTVDVWNGEAWSTTTVQLTGLAQTLVTVRLTNGLALRCTPYHKFLVVNGGAGAPGTLPPPPRRVAAQDLVPGQVLQAWTAPLVDAAGARPMADAYLCGRFAGLGPAPNPNPTPNQGLTGQVPLDADLDSRLRWLEGLVDAVGAVEPVTGHLVLTPQPGAGTDWLQSGLLLLQTLGVAAAWVAADDGRLRVPAAALRTLGAHGFAPRNVALPAGPLAGDDGLGGGTVPVVAVVDVVSEGHQENTYCFNEPLRHQGVFGGILTGNCSEIMEYSSAEHGQTAVCTLGSISLPSCLRLRSDAAGPDAAAVGPGREDRSAYVFDFDKLGYLTAVLLRNLNRIIDITFYPIPSTAASNRALRPVGIGLQGFADVCALLKLPMSHPLARKLNRDIAQVMYYHAAKASHALAVRDGAYAHFAGSPLARGQFQFDLWGIAPEPLGTGGCPDAAVARASGVPVDTALDWAHLREAVMRDGVRNSLWIALMPTASTSQILGNTESFEPFTSNLYTRRTMAGDFIVVNPYLVRDLLDRGLWTLELKQKLVAAQGSLRRFGDDEIPGDLKDRYQTVWDIPARDLVEMSAERAPFVCQSQSLNLYVAEPTPAALTQLHMLGWKRGLKTGSYYIRSKPAVQTVQFTVDAALSNRFRGGASTTAAAAASADSGAPSGGGLPAATAAAAAATNPGGSQDDGCLACSA